MLPVTTFLHDLPRRFARAELRLLAHTVDLLLVLLALETIRDVHSLHLYQDGLVLGGKRGSVQHLARSFCFIYREDEGDTEDCQKELVHRRSVFDVSQSIAHYIFLSSQGNSQVFMHRY